MNEIKFIENVQIHCSFSSDRRHPFSHEVRPAEPFRGRNRRTKANQSSLQIQKLTTNLIDIPLAERDYVDFLKKVQYHLYPL